MKKYVCISIFICFALLFQNCRTAKVPYNAMVSGVTDNNLPNGLIHLRSTGKGNSEEGAISDAERNAFNALLFVGIPGSAQERPMIADASGAKAANPSYFQSFFEQQAYRNFINNITNGGFTKDTDGKRITTIDVKINLTALRNDLENNHIIRKLGL